MCRENVDWAQLCRDRDHLWNLFEYSNERLGSVTERNFLNIIKFHGRLYTSESVILNVTHTWTF